MPAVVEVIPIPPESGGADVESGGAYPLRFLVQMDGVYTDHTAIITATDGVTSIPAYGAAHPSDTTAFVVDKQASPDEESPDWWTVTVYYRVPSVSPTPAASPAEPPATTGGTPPTPITSQKIKWKWYRKSVVFEVDQNGDDVRNSAGDPFDPPAQVEELYAEVTIERTQSTFDENWMIAYRNARNKKAVTLGKLVCAVSTLKVMDIEADYPAGSGGNAWQVRITLRYDPVDEHTIFILDAGYRYKDGATRKRFIDELTATPSTQPRRLNGAGAALGDANANIFMDFYHGPEVDFANLAIGYPT